MVVSEYFHDQYTPNDHHSLAPLYDQKFDTNPNKVYTFWKVKIVNYKGIFIKVKKIKVFYSEYSALFPKVQRFTNQVRFQSDLSGRTRSTSSWHLSLKSNVGEILITCLLCAWCAVTLWDLMKHTLVSAPRKVLACRISPVKRLLLLNRASGLLLCLRFFLTARRRRAVLAGGSVFFFFF